MRWDPLCLWLAALFTLPVSKVMALDVLTASAPEWAIHFALPLQQEDPDYEIDVLDFLDNYCLSCHDGINDTGKLDLGAHEYLEDARNNPDLYWLAAYKVWDHSMPPPRKRKQPSTEERAAFLAWVDAANGLGTKAPEGKTVLRRLNRSQYRRSILELFDLELPEEMITNLPEDESGDGFDNIGASLTLSDEAFIRYLETAEFIADQTIRIIEKQIQTQHFVGSELEVQNKSGTHAALYSRGEAFTEVYIEQPGRYIFRIGAWGNQAGEETCKMGVLVDNQSIADFEVPHDEKNEGVFTKEIKLAKGTHRIAANFLNDYYKPDAPNGEPKDRNLYISWLGLEGPLEPLPPTSFQIWLFKDLAVGTTESTNASYSATLINILIPYLWRREPTEKEREFYQTLFHSVKGTVETKAQSVLIAGLISPHFLFETSVQDSVIRSNERNETREQIQYGEKLATHLSLFLWSSYPDQELLQAASDPTWFRNTTAIAAQVNRMLEDPRANALAEDFASQCFRIRGLRGREIDQSLYPKIDEALLNSMLQETYTFFMDNLRNERNLNHLLSAEYSFLNRELADHYGIEWPSSDSDWQRIDLSKTNRRGILGHASILTVTSLPNRTAPVRRGKWIMENLLGSEPPPPPDNAGQLDESPQVVASAPLRERLAAHRENPDCISCHLVMDPLGFSLENFDAVGRWREQNGEFPVDSGGELPDGTEIKDLKDLVQIINQQDNFSRLLISRLTSYALGRSLVPGDRILIQNILDQLDPQNPSLKQAIQAIVASRTFRNQTP